jgi:glutathione S-transferase
LSSIVNGLPLTESLLILRWLEKRIPEPSSFTGDLDVVISQAGCVTSVNDAMVHVMIGVMQCDPNFGEHRVGRRRRRPIVNGLAAFEAETPAHEGGTPSVAVLTSVVALD